VALRSEKVIFSLLKNHEPKNILPIDLTIYLCVCIYLAFKYGNVKVDLYLKGSGASRVAVG
jgi:hypothetical protein